MIESVSWSGVSPGQSVLSLPFLHVRCDGVVERRLGTLLVNRCIQTVPYDV